MTLPPMAQRLKDWMFSLQEARNTPVPLPKPVADVASWLRGDEARCQSLIELLNHRVTGREALPLPSNPHEVFLLVGRDREARELSRLLSSLCSSPVEVGNAEEEYGGPDPDRGLSR